MTDYQIYPKVKRLCFLCKRLTCKDRSELVISCTRYSPRPGIREVRG